MIPAILGALGSAAGGAGAAASAVGASELAGTAGQLAQLSGAAQQATGGLSRLTPSVHGFASVITALPAKVLEAKAVITSTFDTFVSALAAPMDTVKQLGDSISRFVRLSNPATVTVFEYKVENMFAALGKALEPILASLGRAADEVNKAFSKLGPSLKEAGVAAAGVVDAIANEIVPAARELAPLIRTQAMLWRMLGGVISATGVPILRFTDALQRMGVNLGPLKGLVGGVDENAPNAVAARPPRLTTAEQLQRSTSESSITASLAAGGPKKQTTEGILDQILKFLQENLSKDALLKLIDAIGIVIQNNLPDLPKLPGGVELPTVGDILDHLR